MACYFYNEINIMNKYNGTNARTIASLVPWHVIFIRINDTFLNFRNILKVEHWKNSNNNNHVAFTLNIPNFKKNKYGDDIIDQHNILTKFTVNDVLYVTIVSLQLII